MLWKFKNTSSTLRGHTVLILTTVGFTAYSSSVNEVSLAFPCYKYGGGVYAATVYEIQIHAICTVGCSDFYFFKNSKAFHPLVVGLGPNELKNVFKNGNDPGIPCGHFCHLSL